MKPRQLLRRVVFQIFYHLYVKPRMKRTVTTSVRGHPFVVYPSVFHPSLFLSSKIFVDFITTLDLNGKKVLDMGTGSGVLAVFAAFQGATVIAIDKNAEAVRCAHTNGQQNNVGHRIRVLHGDFFSPIPSSDRFDYIFFNPPFYPQEPSSTADLAWKAGDRFRLLAPFARGARPHLEPHGKIFLILSSDVDFGVFLEVFRMEGYHVRPRLERNLLFERMCIYELGL